MINTFSKTSQSSNDHTVNNALTNASDSNLGTDASNGENVASLSIIDERNITGKVGGFSAQELSKIALEALSSFADSFTDNRDKDSDNGDKALGSDYGRATDLIANTQSISESLGNLEALQSDALQMISGAEDNGNLVLKEVQDLSGFVAHISNSVKSINDIAERVHVLSLNAAIEAARAGERGKGFAVVASEIRSLAGSTAQRVEEISEYIRQSSSTVERLVSGTHTTVTSVTSTHSKLSSAADCRKEVFDFAQKISSEVHKIKNLHLIETLSKQHSLLRIIVFKYLLKGELFSEDIPNSRQCPLGHWYRENRSTMRSLSDTSIYRRLDEAHETFHATILQVQKAMQYENQDQVIKLLNNLESSNRQISDILLEIASALQVTDPVGTLAQSMS